MKRFFIILVLLLLPLASARERIYEDNSLAGETSFSTIGTTNPIFGQSFTIGATGANVPFVLTNISFFINTTSLNLGNLTINLQEANSSGYPNGRIVARGIFNADQALVRSNVTNITFVQTRVIHPSGRYAIVFPPLAGSTVSQSVYAGGNNYFGALNSTLTSQAASMRFIMWGQNDSLALELGQLDYKAFAPINLNSTLYGFNLINFTNATIFVWDSSATLVNTSINFFTGNTTNVTTFTPTNLLPGRYDWNVRGCAQNSSTTQCRLQDFNQTTIVGAAVESEIYDDSVISGNLEYFALNLTYNNTYFTSISTTFTYNNTSYSPTQFGSSANVLFNNSVTIPFTTPTVEKNFFWTIALTNSSGSVFSFNTTQRFQTVSSLAVDNCTSQSTVLMRFKLYDEPTRVETNGTIEALVNLYTPGTDNLVTTFNKSYSFVANADNARVCISSIGSGYTMDYQTRYQINSSYAQENKYGQNVNVTSSVIPQNISLYDIALDVSEAFTFTVQGADLSSIAGAIIDIQRQYIPINQFLSVESPLTDSRGTSIAHLVENDVLYNFIVSKDGVLLGTFNNYLVKCQNQVTGQCEITLNLIQSTTDPEDYQNYGNISVNFVLNRVTSVLSMLFFSTDGNSHTVELDLFKNDGYGNTSICSQSTTASSGTLQCTIPAIYANTSIIAEVSSDGTFVGRHYFSLAPSSSDIFSGIRVILGLLMYSTIALLMIGNPITMIIGAMLGLFFAGAFHVVDGGSLFGNTAVLLWFILAGGILIYFFSKRI